MGGSGYGRAEAACAESAPATMAPESSAAAHARVERLGPPRPPLDLRTANPRTLKGL
ncbi:hypothetical protein [Streptomyces flavofungini]|uniref:hypothetical protein n=1 Tax=Streptomyces flavofungini TaxID=68200 RepID=UPI0034DE7B41